jgi:hypothetical protein
MWMRMEKTYLRGLVGLSIGSTRGLAPDLAHLGGSLVVSSETVLGRHSLVGGAVLLETVVLKKDDVGGR